MDNIYVSQKGCKGLILSLGMMCYAIKLTSVQGALFVQSKYF